jgi:hypothetical protein
MLTDRLRLDQRRDPRPTRASGVIELYQTTGVQIDHRPASPILRGTIAAERFTRQCFTPHRRRPYQKVREGAAVAASNHVPPRGLFSGHFRFLPVGHWLRDVRPVAGLVGRSLSSYCLPRCRGWAPWQVGGKKKCRISSDPRSAFMARNSSQGLYRRPFPYSLTTN